MRDNKTEECFGKWGFEDVTCMQCKNESACQIDKENKEVEYKKSIKDSRCHNCMDISRCHQTLKSCIGNFKKKCEETRCKCRYECQKQSFKEIKVVCQKSIKMIQWCEKYTYTFEHGKEYTLYHTESGLLSTSIFFCDVILGRKTDYKRIGGIFDNYFKII